MDSDSRISVAARLNFASNILAGAIVHDDKLPITVLLRNTALDGVTEVPPTVVRG
jgi:hypothetical protein